MSEREDKPRRYRNSDGSNTRSDKKIGNLKKEHENK